MTKGNEMAAITEAALEGEWFYLVEEQPLDRASDNFYILRHGEVMQSGDQQVIGVYRVYNGCWVITLHRTVPFTTSVELRCTDETFDEMTPMLAANTTHTLPDGGDPLYLYGSFVRRVSDHPSTADVRSRLP